MCIWYLEGAAPALSLTSWQTMESKVPFFREILRWETSAKEPTEAFRDGLHEDCAEHHFWNLNQVRAGKVLKSCGFEVLTSWESHICPSHGRNSTHLLCTENHRLCSLLCGQVPGGGGGAYLHHLIWMEAETSGHRAETARVRGTVFSGPSAYPTQRL